MTQTTYSQYIDDHSSTYQSSRSENVTINLLDRLLIVPVRSIEGKGKNIEKYELLLLGVLLLLDMISRKEDKMYTYYDKTASNYRQKLPLIFGKWR
jgi:hypothetical protein